jgi:hypothetical protein
MHDFHLIALQLAHQDFTIVNIFEQPKVTTLTRGLLIKGAGFAYFVFI